MKTNRFLAALLAAALTFSTVSADMTFAMDTDMDIAAAADIGIIDASGDVSGADSGLITEDDGTSVVEADLNAGGEDSSDIIQDAPPADDGTGTDISDSAAGKAAGTAADDTGAAGDGTAASQDTAAGTGSDEIISDEVLAASDEDTGEQNISSPIPDLDSDGKLSEAARTEAVQDKNQLAAGSPMELTLDSSGPEGHPGIRYFSFKAPDSGEYFLDVTMIQDEGTADTGSRFIYNYYNYLKLPFWYDKDGNALGPDNEQPQINAGLMRTTRTMEKNEVAYATLCLTDPETPVHLSLKAYARPAAPTVTDFTLEDYPQVITPELPFTLTSTCLKITYSDGTTGDYYPFRGSSEDTLKDIYGNPIFIDFGVKTDPWTSYPTVNYVDNRAYIGVIRENEEMQPGTCILSAKVGDLNPKEKEFMVSYDHLGKVTLAAEEIVEGETLSPTWRFEDPVVFQRFKASSDGYYSISIQNAPSDIAVYDAEDVAQSKKPVMTCRRGSSGNMTFYLPKDRVLYVAELPDNALSSIPEDKAFSITITNETKNARTLSAGKNALDELSAADTADYLFSWPAGEKTYGEYTPVFTFSGEGCEVYAEGGLQPLNAAQQTFASSGSFTCRPDDLIHLIVRRTQTEGGNTPVLRIVRSVTLTDLSASYDLPDEVKPKLYAPATLDPSRIIVSYKLPDGTEGTVRGDEANQDGVMIEDVSFLTSGGEALSDPSDLPVGTYRFRATVTGSSGSAAEGTVEVRPVTEYWALDWYTPGNTESLSPGSWDFYQINLKEKEKSAYKLLGSEGFHMLLMSDGNGTPVAPLSDGTYELGGQVYYLYARNDGTESGSFNLAEVPAQPQDGTGYVLGVGDGRTHTYSYDFTAPKTGTRLISAGPGTYDLKLKDDAGNVLAVSADGTYVTSALEEGKAYRLTFTGKPYYPADGKFRIAVAGAGTPVVTDAVFAGGRTLYCGSYTEFCDKHDLNVTISQLTVDGSIAQRTVNGADGAEAFGNSAETPEPLFYYPGSAGSVPYYSAGQHPPVVMRNTFYVNDQDYSIPVSFGNLTYDSVNAVTAVGLETSLEDQHFYRLHIDEDGYYTVLMDQGSEDNPGGGHIYINKKGDSNDLVRIQESFDWGSKSFWLSGGDYIVCGIEEVTSAGEDGKTVGILSSSFTVKKIAALTEEETPVSISGQGQVFYVPVPSDGSTHTYRLSVSEGLSGTIYRGEYYYAKTETISGGGQSAVYSDASLSSEEDQTGQTQDPGGTDTATGQIPQAATVLYVTGSGSTTGTVTMRVAAAPGEVFLRMKDGRRFFDRVNHSPKEDDLNLFYTDESGQSREVSLDQAVSAGISVENIHIEEAEDDRYGYSYTPGEILSAGKYRFAATVAGKAVYADFTVIPFDDDDLKAPSALRTQNASAEKTDWYYLYSCPSSNGSGAVTHAMDIWYQSSSASAEVLPLPGYHRNSSAGSDPGEALELKSVEGTEQTSDQNTEAAGQLHPGDHVFTATEGETYLIHIHSEDPAAAVAFRSADEQLTAELASQDHPVWDGLEKRPEITVKKADGTTLPETTADQDGQTGQDSQASQGTRNYSITYSDNINAGTGHIKVAGAGGYAGLSADADFTIYPLDINSQKIQVSMPDPVYYAFTAAEPEVSVTFKDGDRALVLEKNKDFTVSYKGNDGVGEAKAIVTGAGSLTGSLVKSFDIKVKSVPVSEAEAQTKDFTGNGKLEAGDQPVYIKADIGPHTHAAFSIFGDKSQLKDVFFYELDESEKNWVPSSDISRSLSDTKIVYSQPGEYSDGQEEQRDRTVVVYVPAGLRALVKIDKPLREGEETACSIEPSSAEVENGSAVQPQTYYFTADKGWRYLVSGKKDQEGGTSDSISLKVIRSGRGEASYTNRTEHAVDLAKGVHFLTVTSAGTESAKFTVSKAQAPAKITDVRTVASQENIEVAWSIANTTEDTRYKIWRKDVTEAAPGEGGSSDDTDGDAAASAEQWTLLKTVYDRELDRFTDPTPERGHKYVYAVSALIGTYMEGPMSDPTEETELLADTTNPQVLSMSPDTGCRIGASGQIRFSASAEDNIAVTMMELYILPKTDDEKEEPGDPVFSSDSGKMETQLTFAGEEYPEGDYQVIVRAYDAAGNVGEKKVFWQLDKTAPDPVEDLTCKDEDITDITAMLSWSYDQDANADLDRFIVERKSGEEWTFVTSCRTLGTNIAKLVPETYYKFRVLPVDQTGNRGESREITFTTKADTMSPVVTYISPKGGYYNDKATLTATAKDEYNVAWTAFEYSEDGGETFTEIEGSRNTYEDVNVSRTLRFEYDLKDRPDGIVTFRAVAGDAPLSADGETIPGNVTEGVNAPSSQFFVDHTAPAAPEGLTLKVSEKSADALELNWTGISEGGITYEIFRRTSGQDGSTSTEYARVASGYTYTNWFDQNLKSGITYSYKVRAKDAAGNIGDFSKEVSIAAPEDKKKPVIRYVTPSEETVKPYEDQNGQYYVYTSAFAGDNRVLKSLKLYAGFTANSDGTPVYDEAPYHTGTDARAGSGVLQLSGIRLSLPGSIKTGDTVYLKAVAADGDGNESEMEASFTVDMTAPSIGPVSFVLDQTNRVADISWSLTDDDAVNADTQGFYIYRVTKDGTTTLAAAIAYESGKKDYSITDQNVSRLTVPFAYSIEAVDRCGNRSAAVTDYKMLPEGSPEVMYDPPRAALSCSRTMKAGAEYSFDASGSSAYEGLKLVSYTFDFGDGSKLISGVSPYTSHTYADPGTYTVKLTVADDKGLTAQFKRSVLVQGAETFGTLDVKVVDESGELVEDAPVYFDLGDDSQIIGKTGRDGMVTFTGDFGLHVVGCYKEHYLPVKDDVVMLPGKNTLTLTIKKEELVTGEFEIHRMTLDEIIKAGIDVNDPDNQYVASIDVQLKYDNKTDIDLISLPVTYNYTTKQVVGQNHFTRYVPGSGLHEMVVQVLDSEGTVAWDHHGTISDQEIAPKDVTVVVLDIPVSVSALKEFFDVKLHIMNHSDTFSIKDNDVTLNIPNGLSLVKTYQSLDSSRASISEIMPQQTETLEWILRGDKIGSYHLTADFAGTLTEFNQRVTARFEAETPIDVVGFSHCDLKITVPQFFDHALENDSSDPMGVNMADYMNYVLEFNNRGPETINGLKFKMPEGDEMVSMRYYSKEADQTEKGYTELSGSIPPEFGQGDKVVIYMRRKIKKEYSLFSLKNWYTQVYGETGLNVTLEVDTDAKVDDSVLVYSGRTMSPMKHESISVNGTEYTTDENGVLYLSVPDDVDLEFQAEGYETYKISSGLLLGKGGTHEIYLPVITVGQKREYCVTGMFYRKSLPDEEGGDSGDGKTWAVWDTNWYDAFSKGLSVFPDDIYDDHYDIQVSTYWAGKEPWKVVLAGKSKKIEKNYIQYGRPVVFNSVDLSQFDVGDTLSVYLVSIDGERSAARQTGITIKAGSPLNDFLKRSTFTVGGKMEVELADVPIIGKDKLSIDLAKFPMSVSVTRDTVKAAINLGGSSADERIQLFKNNLKGLSDKKKKFDQYQLERSLKKYGGGKEEPVKWITDGPALTHSLSGYIIWQIVDGGLRVKEGEILVTFGISGSLKRDLPLATIPIYLKLDLGGEGSGEGKFTKPLVDSNLPYSVEMKVNIKPYLKLTSGIGYSGIVGVECSGGISLDIEFHPPSSDGQVKLKWETGVRAYCGPFSLDIDKLQLKGEKTLFSEKEEDGQDDPDDSEGSGGSGSGGGGDGDTLSAMMLMAMYAPESYTAVADSSQEEQWQPLSPEGEGSTVTDILRENEELRAANAYPDARPSLVEAGDVTMMVWLRQVPERGSANSTVISYSIRGDESGNWSEPRAVLDDGTADMAPSVDSEDGKIYVTWQNSTKKYGDTESPSLLDFGKNTEILTAVYDRQADTFTEAGGEGISAPEGGAVSDPRTIRGNGTVFRTYLVNSDGNILGSTGDNTLMASELQADGSFSDPAAVMRNSGMVSGYAAAVSGGKLYAAWSARTGTDLSSIDDYEIWLSDWENGTEPQTMRLTENQTADMSPFFTEEDGKEVLCWNGGEGTERYEISAADSDASENGTSGDDADSNAAGSTVQDSAVPSAEKRQTLITKDGTYVLFLGDSEKDKDASEIWCSQYLGAGSYSSPVPVTELGRKILSFHALAEKDGDITLLYEAREISRSGSADTGENTDGNADEDVTYGSAAIYTMKIHPCMDLAIAEADGMVMDDIYPGAPVSIDLTVENRGTLPIGEGYLIQLVNKATGDVVYTRTQYQGLLVGEKRDETIDYDLPLDFTGADYEIRVSIRAGKDSKESNNKASVRAPGGELTIESVSAVGEGSYLSIAVKTRNTGAAKLDNISLTASADKEGTKIIGSASSIDSLSHGQIRTNTIEIEDKEKEQNLISDDDGVAKVYITAKSGDVRDQTAYYIRLDENTGLSEEEKAAIKAFRSSLGQVGKPEEVTVESEDTIAAARTAYDALSDLCKSYVTTEELKKLTDAEAALKKRKEEKAAAEKAAAEKAAAEKAAAEKAAAEKAAAEKAAAEKAAAEKAAAEKAAAEKAAAEKAAAEKAAAEKAAAEKSAAEKAAAKKAAEEKAAAEKAAAEKAAAEKAAAEKAAAEKAAEKAAAEKAAAEKAAAEKTAAEKAAAEKAAAEKTAAEKAAAERAAAEASKPVLPASSAPMKMKQKTKAIFVSGVAPSDYVTGWTSSNTKIVKVAKRGAYGCTLKAGKKKGKAVITVRLASGKSASMIVYTQKKKVRTKKISISCGRNLVLRKGQIVSIGASLVPVTTQDKLKFKSSKKKIAAVTKKGIIVAKKKGKTTITVQSGKKKIKIKVTVR